MPRITIESINQELEQYGWKCVSEVYKNLDTELEFLCEEGHTVCASWKKIRTRREFAGNGDFEQPFVRKQSEYYRPKSQRLEATLPASRFYDANRRLR